MCQFVGSSVAADSAVVAGTVDVVVVVVWLLWVRWVPAMGLRPMVAHHSGKFWAMFFAAGDAAAAATAAAAAAAAQEQLRNLDVREGPVCEDDVDEPDEGAQVMAVTP